MCEFKFCAGEHACFLKDVSPCPRATKVAAAETNGETADKVTQLNLSRKGFLDRDQLIAALGLDDAAPEQPQPGKIIRIASKLQLAAAYMGNRAAS